MTEIKRVLIADDDEDLAAAIGHRCRLAGLIVETVYDGKSAVHKIDSLEPDLVILDVNMPSGSGLSVGEMISRDPRLKVIPLIMLTGCKDEETIRRCQCLSAHYVPKGPDAWSRIEPLVQELLGLVPASDPAAIQSNGVPTAEIHRAEPRHLHPASGHPDTGRKRSRRRITGGQPIEEPRTEAEQIDDCYIESVLSAFGWRKAACSALALPDEHESPATRPCVLCIDDDCDFSNSLMLRLKQHGVKVTQAFAGLEGYRRAFTSEVQAIVLDYEMPDGNGDYVLRRLKEGPTSDIPVIVLTGRKDRILERTMRNMGAAQFLAKPVEWDKLLGELGRYVRLTPEPMAS